MKKLISLLTTLALTAMLLCGCGSGQAQTPTGFESNFKVAIVQQMDHSSLDEIRAAIAARLQELAKEQGPGKVGIRIEEFNGQNDSSTLNQIGSQVVSDGYDMIIPIATTAAQCMVTAADGSGIPVVYSAISDPESAGLTGLSGVTGISDALNTQFILDMMLAVQPEVKTVGLLYSNSEINSATPIAELSGVTGISDALNTQFILDMMLAVQPEVKTVGLLYSNSEINSATPIAEAKAVTGISDALNTQFILDMMLAVQPEVKTVGLLYSNSEINSATPIAEAKAYLESKGIAYLEKTSNSTLEIVEAASSLVGRVDAVFTPTDNVVMAAEAAVAELLAEGGIPHYTGADSFVLSGAFAASGVNYTQLGIQTAELAYDILTSGTVPTDFQKQEGGIITVNTDTAAQLNLDTAAFAKMASQVREVTTVGE